MFTHTYISVLTIAGSDSGGGAGIQADLKTFAAMGCYGTSAITAITAQNTLGITDIHPVPANVVKAQIRAVLEDIEPGAVKIGMIYSVEQVMEVAEVLAARKALKIGAHPGTTPPPIVLDPVLISSSGTQLAKQDTIQALIRVLFPLTRLITPNLPEAEVLCGFPVQKIDDMRRAAHHLIGTGAGAVLVKGGHMSGDRITDLYVDRDGQELVFESDRIYSPNLHGTGCTLSAAIAACLALGDTLEKAIARARAYVLLAIETGKHIRTGHGQGPLNHAHVAQALRESAL